MDSAAAWATSVASFLRASDDEILDALAGHHERQMHMRPARSQEAAWAEETEILRAALAECVAERRQAATWGVVLEYELPLEGGRRPDAVVLAGGSVAVLEFKQQASPTRASVDQTEGYARDISDYHAASHGRHVVPILVLTRAHGIALDFDPVVITGSDDVAHYLLGSSSDGEIAVEEWVSAPYEPLPTLVAAARRIFQHKPLPHVHAALAEDIPGTLSLIGQLVGEAEAGGKRLLILVGGVPGSGKTLVGLRLVYERLETQGRGLLLSGNGPLVQVLQHALESKAFVRDLHAFIRTNGINGKAPNERIVVFDEAQRAWSSDYMQFKRDIARSEPEFLVEIGERIPGWAVLVGLVGEGQEIFSGEEAGIGQWRDAILGATPELWEVHVPPHLATEFMDCDVRTHDKLALSVSLRSRRAEFLHDWVAHLLAGSLPLAARLARRLEQDAAGFPLYVTRELDAAKEYAKARYAEEADKRYGLMVAAHAKVPRRHGVDSHYMAMQQLRLGPWFNAPPEDPASCCQLTAPVTEFQVQGLEIDLPIVCWGEDYLWTGAAWKKRPARARFHPDDPAQLLTNAYRVLLTRGRDGLIVFVPPESEFDLTEVALLAAGLKPLEEAGGEVEAAARRARVSPS